jgi:DNA-directed RNA polymerase specialized sigma24 family protein
MSTLNAQIGREVFANNVKLVYSIARKWCPRMLAWRGVYVAPAELDEYVQDAVCRAYGNFMQRCERSLPAVSERRAWVGQCAMSGVKNATKTARRFGNPVPQPGYIDAMNRRGNSRGLSFRHGSDEERRKALESIPCREENPSPAEPKELLALLDREGLKAELRDTAFYAMIGLSTEQSGQLQGVTDREVRYRLQEIREYLNPNANPYYVIVSALKEVLAR